MIKNLYYGNIIRSEHIVKSEEYKKLSEQWLSLANSFEKTLTPEQVDLFNQIVDTISKCNEMSCSAIYEAGFCDGAKIMLEVLNSSDTVNI